MLGTVTFIAGYFSSHIEKLQPFQRWTDKVAWEIDTHECSVISTETQIKRYGFTIMHKKALISLLSMSGIERY